MYTPTYIATAQTKVCRSTPGKLGTIVIEGGAAGTIIGYDNSAAATGDILFSFDSTNALASYRFDLVFKNGLTVITSADTKLTIMTAPQSN